MKYWNIHHFGHIQTKIKSLMSQISEIQSSPHSPSSAAIEVSLQEALQEQLLRGEVLWRQKSRELGLSCTDLNTKFFHASIACRRRYNSIDCLRSTDGSNISGMENIGSFLVNHFSNLFSTTHPIFDSSFNDLVDNFISDEENVRLCVIPDECEIFSAISELGLNKAPGPNGMTGLFYKSYWPILKISVIDSMQSFLGGVICLRSLTIQTLP